MVPGTGGAYLLPERVCPLAGSNSTGAVAPCPPGSVGEGRDSRILLSLGDGEVSLTVCVGGVPPHAAKRE